MPTSKSMPDCPAPSSAARSMAWYWRLSRWITPGLLNAQYRYSERLLSVISPGCRWLDIGCGSTPLRNSRDLAGDLKRLCDRPAVSVGIDVHEPTLSNNQTLQRCVVADACDLPFDDGSFDVVSANMVAEHLDDPAAVLAEAARVLAPGGRLLIHTPNRYSLMVMLAALAPERLTAKVASWLEGRPEAAVFPTHYRLNDVATIRRLAREAGLELARMEYVEDAPTTIALGPLVAVELLWIRATRWSSLASLRDNLIFELVKPEPAAASDRATRNRIDRSRVAA